MLLGASKKSKCPFRPHEIPGRHGYFAVHWSDIGAIVTLDILNRRVRLLPIA